MNEMVTLKTYLPPYAKRQCQEIFLPNIVSIGVIIVHIFSKDSFLKIFCFVAAKIKVALLLSQCLRVQLLIF